MSSPPLSHTTRYQGWAENTLGSMPKGDVVASLNLPILEQLEGRESTTDPLGGQGVEEIGETLTSEQ